MKSMTGYGRGEYDHEGVKYVVEINSVNRRQSDILVTTPKELVELEPRIRDEINARVSRGRLNVVVAIHGAEQQKLRAELDVPLAKKYLRAIEKLQKEVGLNGSIALDTILRAPGVFKLTESKLEADAAWHGVEKALKQALDRLVKMREKEGRHLRADLAKRLTDIEQRLQRVRERAPATRKKYQQTLHERIQSAGLELPLDDERILKEVVFFAERSDISEELTRLSSHLQQFREHLDDTQPVGRVLDFLTQEMGREINTIGSKANDAAISREVVNLKSELEKIREQVQNIE
jgi:uncharacterized protein (TIGR00255 family)